MRTAMILAAGRGERMRPLTDTVPKPLLEVAGKPLIEWQIEKLVGAGFKTIIINVAHKGQMIMERLGDGSRWGVEILFSDERDEGALESAGGIVKVLPLIADDIFLVVNADVWCDYRYSTQVTLARAQARLVLVPNPEHNPKGDFSLENQYLKAGEDGETFTFSGIGYYSKCFFEGIGYGKAALGPLIRQKSADNLVEGEVYTGKWVDVGTPERLESINKQLLV